MVTDLRNGIQVPNDLDKFLCRRAMDWEEYEWWLIHLLNINILTAPRYFQSLWSEPKLGANQYRIYTEESIN